MLVQPIIWLYFSCVFRYILSYCFPGMCLLLLGVYCSLCLLYCFFVFKRPVLRSDRIRGLREKMREHCLKVVPFQKDTETKVILAHFLYSKTSERHMYVCLFPPLLSRDSFRAIVLSSFDDFNNHTQSHQRHRERTKGIQR